jgi:hypothetical protein
MHTDKTGGSILFLLTRRCLKPEFDHVAVGPKVHRHRNRGHRRVARGGIATGEENLHRLVPIKVTIVQRPT